MRHLISMCIIVACSIQGACSVSGEPTNIGMAHACDVANAECSIHSGPYSLALKLGPDVKPLRPFAAILKFNNGGIKLQDVVMDFRMVDMDMGLNRYKLTQSGDAWTGNVTLPVCTASRTDWLAIVEFSDAGKRYTASFPFHTNAE